MGNIVKLRRSCAFVPHMWSHLSFSQFFSTFLHFPLEYINLSFCVSPPLGPAVLKPGFDLGVCHFESFSQSCSFSAGQVFLSVEALLQLTDLHSGERRTGLFSLRWCAVLVRVTNTPSHSERRQGCCGMWIRREKPVTGEVSHDKSDSQLTDLLITLNHFTQ